MALQKTLSEITRRIRQENLYNKNYPIPSSDTFYDRHVSDICESQERLREHLQILEEARHVFVFTLTEADQSVGLPAVDGYVVAERTVLTSLLDHYHKKLQALYESVHNRRKGANEILQELMGRLNDVRNSSLGSSARICVMLKQYELTIQRNEEGYADPWKAQKLDELLNKKEGGQEEDFEIKPEADEIEYDSYNQETPEQLSEAPPEKPDSFEEMPKRRAIDTEEYHRHVSQMKFPNEWERAVSRYGVRFLLRIHFRKYEFQLVKRLIQTGRITEKEDLCYVRDTIRTMEGRLSFDFRLERHLMRMHELRRLAQMALNRLR